MTHISLRTQPEDEDNLRLLCEHLNISRSEALRLSLATAVSCLLKQKRKKRPHSMGCYEDTKVNSVNYRKFLKKKLNA